MEQTKTTIDLTPGEVPEELKIMSMEELTAAVAEIAKAQTGLNEHEARMQRAVEDAKVAFDAATSAVRAGRDAAVARVREFCGRMRELIFPKGTKTIKVLGHKLRYRESASLESPKEAAELVRGLINEMKGDLDGGRCDATAVMREINLLSTLLRPVSGEVLDKAATTRTIEADPAAAALLRGVGITVDRSESFAVDLMLSPEGEG